MKSGPSPRLKSAPSSVVQRWPAVVVAGLLVLYMVMAESAATQKGAVFDEGFHLTIGYLYWTHPAYRLSPDNGIGAQAWAALPLLLDHGLKFPPVVDATGKPTKHLVAGPRFPLCGGKRSVRYFVQARIMVSLMGAALWGH